MAAVWAAVSTNCTGGKYSQASMESFVAKSHKYFSKHISRVISSEMNIQMKTLHYKCGQAGIVRHRFLWTHLSEFWCFKRLPRNRILSPGTMESRNTLCWKGPTGIIKPNSELRTGPSTIQTVFDLRVELWLCPPPSGADPFPRCHTEQSSALPLRSLWGASAAIRPPLSLLCSGLSTPRASAAPHTPCPPHPSPCS